MESGWALAAAWVLCRFLGVSAVSKVLFSSRGTKLSIARFFFERYSERLICAWHGALAFSAPVLNLLRFVYWHGEPAPGHLADDTEMLVDRLWRPATAAAGPRAGESRLEAALPDDVVFRVAEFLTAADLLAAAPASRSAAKVCLGSAAPWVSLTRRLWADAHGGEAPAWLGAAAAPAGAARQRFFALASNSALRFVAARGLRVGESLVVVDGVALDVAAFADAHPGGRAVLDYYAGRDASPAFRSFHARNGRARAVCQQLAVFSPRKFVGSARLPQKAVNRELRMTPDQRRAADDHKSLMERLRLRRLGVFAIPRRPPGTMGTGADDEDARSSTSSLSSLT
ncbi:hypothetical protein M885DRAFT_621152 [Pelagophyceae sp. CCMP2097]|nr:hypothetical protein M885DRAFT_621152 [Pelagophyceae sp. CCMP2097]